MLRRRRHARKLRRIARLLVELEAAAGRKPGARRREVRIVVGRS